MADTKIFEILDGPSELDMVFSLMRGQEVSLTVTPSRRTDMPHPGLPTFRVSKGPKLKIISIPVEATINGMEIESGSRKTWIVKGVLKPFGGNPGGNFSGFIVHTKGRTGFIEVAKA